MEGIERELIKSIKGDITGIKGVDYIVNAANGVGIMGTGVAGAIRRAGGYVIQQEAVILCVRQRFQPGDFYVTNAGTLPYKGVIHLVTMSYPGGKTSYEIIGRCLKNLISFCRIKRIKRVALPALGTGVGKLDPHKVAEIFRDNLSNVNDVEFWVVDIDPVFILCLEKILEKGGLDSE